MKKYSLVAVMWLCALIAHAQLDNNQEKFDNIFDFRSTPYRSASGAPGVMYWQNAADYYIDADLDSKSHKLSATVKITYTNNSPEELSFLWLQLDQNKFKKDSRGTFTMPVEGGRHVANTTSGYNIKSVKVDGKTAKYVISDTRLQILLEDKSVKAKGGKSQIEIAYSFDIPEYGADRMGRKKFGKGWVYTIAQWYPRMCVFDDIKGWNVEPYLGAGEFYLEYGDLEYKIKTSNDIVLLGSGELLNPKEVYTAEQLKRWEKAEKSNETVSIISKNEVGKKKSRPSKSSLTWHYKIKNARDIAFGASSAFIVDAAKIDLPNGQKCTAISAYPAESDGNKAWSRSTEYTKASIEHYSKMWYVYPYPTAVNVAGIVGGMEYPGVSFCSWKSQTSRLWGVTDHEFGHNWFPMIIGTNERLYPWMDEGFNTFINFYSTNAFNKGEYAKDPHSIDKMGDPNLMFYIFNKERESIATYPDVVQDNHLGVTAYYKPAMGLLLLREYIIGKERFDFAFRTYIKRWAFKHPTPIDFFNSMENAAGEELDWFWKQWFYGNGTLDQAVTAVTHPKDEASKGAIITLESKGELVLPIVLEIEEEGGNKTRVKVPVDIWKKGNKKKIHVETTKKVISVKIDPDNILPDVQRNNNTWSK